MNDVEVVFDGVEQQRLVIVDALAERVPVVRVEHGTRTRSEPFPRRHRPLLLLELLLHEVRTHDLIHTNTTLLHFARKEQTSTRKLLHNRRDEL